MPLRIAMCVALLAAGAGWLGAIPVDTQMNDRRVVTTGAPTGAVYSAAVVVAGYIYVSSLTANPPGPSDRPNQADDIGSQTKAVFARLKTILEASGSSMGQLCSVQVSLKSASDFAAMNEAYREVFPPAPPAPPARTTFVSWLRGSTLIEISAVAVPNGTHRETMQPATWGKNPRPYSYIVKTDDLVFFSGLISRRGSDDAPVTGNVRTQMETILDNAGTLLKTAGLTYANVVAARVYLTSPYDFQQMNEVYAVYFQKEAPARATAVVELMSAEASVEVTLVASRQPKHVIGGQAANGLPVSLGIQAGPRVWLSAVIGDTEKHVGKVTEQTRDAFARLKSTIELAGLGFGDVVDTTIYLRDTFDWPKVDAVFRELFPKDPPARTGTGARLVVEPGLVEVLALAVRR